MATLIEALYLILINLNSHVWLVSTVEDSLTVTVCSDLPWSWRFTVSQREWVSARIHPAQPRGWPCPPRLGLTASFQEDWRDSEVQSHHWELHNLNLGSPAQAHSGLMKGQSLPLHFPLVPLNLTNYPCFQGL